MLPYILVLVITIGVVKYILPFKTIELPPESLIVVDKVHTFKNSLPLFGAHGKKQIITA